MEVETINLDNLVDKTVFLRLAFGVFGNLRKTYVEVAGDVNNDRLKHQKQLLDSPELKAIQKADAELRARVELYCLPYDTGLRLLPVQSAKIVTGICKTYADKKRPELLNAFYAVYDKQILDAKEQLGNHYNPLDYPSVAEIKKSFYFHFQLLSFATPGNLEKFAPEVFEEEKKKAQQIWVNAANGVVEALATTAHELVTHLLDKLSSESDGKKKNLHQSAVTHLTEFLGNFKLLNVVDHKGLELEMNKLQFLLNGVDADKIRHSDNLKIELQAKLAESAKAIETLVEIKGRKFRDTPKTQATVEDVKEAAAKVSSITGIDILIPSDETIEAVLAGATLAE